MSEVVPFFSNVLVELGVGPIEPSTDQVVRLVLMPSFRLTSCITVRIPEDGDASVALAIFTRGYWYGSLAKESPTRWDLHASVPGPRARALLRTLDAIVEEELIQPIGWGCDGMTVIGERTGPARSALRFEAWSPHPDTAAHRFDRAVFELAMESLSADRK